MTEGISPQVSAEAATNPGAEIAVLAEAIGKSRTSTVSALPRLRDAGFADSVDRVWRLTDPKEIAELTERSPPPKEAPRWTTPLNAPGSRRRSVEEHAHA
jgi:hypothetical protein